MEGLIPRDRYREGRAVLEAVAAVVGDTRHKPGLQDNFFTIGGDSINIVQV